MAGLFASKTSQLDVVPQRPKSGRISALIRAFVEGYKLASTSSRQTCQQSTSFHSAIVESSASTIRRLQTSSSNSERCISKQISFESTSSYATSTDSSCLEPVREQMPVLDPSVSVANSLAVTIETTATSPPIDHVEICATSDGIEFFACPVAPSLSFSDLSNSTLSSALLNVLPAAFHGGTDSCMGAVTNAFIVSAELYHQSATPGNSTADSSPVKSTYEELIGDEVSSTSSNPVSTDDMDMSTVPASHVSDADEAEIVTSPVTRWDLFKSQNWTGMLSSDSSSSSLGDLALTADDVTDTNPVDEEPEISPSTPSDHLVCPSFGMAGCFLMAHVYASFTTEHGAYYYAAPVERLEAPSAESRPRTQLTVILEEEEPEEPRTRGNSSGAVHCLSDNITSSCPATEEQVTKETINDTSSAAWESGIEREEYSTTPSSADLFVMRVFRKATPLARHSPMEMSLTDMLPFSIIPEEEVDSCDHIVPASARHNSLLAVDSESFEYAQYSLSSENSADSGLGDDARDPSSLVRPVASICQGFSRAKSLD
ncbi:hypothetical protein QFC20_005971 [Naganishia adeliensis]|uniref:Uncharacterized protein n=1 Tax=Naganishia adeliensis TaxID=92952 RepID=A0ACC2VH95_9TREE|nr:hypothetical protein QFC20_005971 [Naganishia adeliensis]